MRNHEQPPTPAEDQPEWPKLPESPEAAKEAAIAKAEALVEAHENGDEEAIAQAEEDLNQALDDIQEISGVDAMLDHLDFLTENHLGNS